MPSDALSRRRFLEAGGVLCAAAASGCVEAFAGDGPDSKAGGKSDSNRALHLSLSAQDGPLRERHVVDLNRTPPPWDEAAFAAALDGSAYTTQHHTPFGTRDGEPKYARRNGTYYRLGSVVVGEETATHPVLRLTTVGRTDELDSVPEHVAQSSLPAGDRRAVKVAYFAARARGNPGGVPWGLVERDGYVYRDADAIRASELLADSGPTHVEYRGTIHEVRVSRETFHEAVHRADVEPVADSEAGVEEALRAELVDARASPEELSREERDVVRRAMGDGYEESHPFSAAFRSVLKKFGHWAYLDGDVENDAGVDADRPLRLLLYGDTYFDYRLAFVSAGD